MKKFYSIDTKEYKPLSKEGKYFYQQYTRIKNFVSKELGEDYDIFLAKPLLDIKNNSINWHTSLNSKLKRINDFEENEKQEIIKIYNQKIKNINNLSKKFQKSQNTDKKAWGSLLKSVFNNNNNIIFSDENKNIVIVWGWKFNNQKENTLLEKKTKNITITTPQNTETKPIKEPLTTPPKKGEFIKFIKNNLWWIILLLILILILFILNPFNTKKNNSGLDEKVYKEILDQNINKKLYDHLLIDKKGNKRIIPKNPRIIIPIDTNNIIIDSVTNIKIVADRINIALKNEDDNILSFAKDFKNKFPEKDYQVIYYDNETNRLQVSLPPSEIYNIKNKIENKMNSYDLLIWHESIFTAYSFNDPDLFNKTKNYHLKNTKAEEAWEITTGKKDIVIAIIDVGFDLNHKELQKNIVKPWNTFNHNDKIFANSSHGTHVAGIALAENNNNFGLSGIAPNCSFMPIQLYTSPDGNISWTNIADGILYAIKNNADVINLSVGMIWPEQYRLILEKNTQAQKDFMIEKLKEAETFWNEIYEMADKKNITIVLAAGNQNLLIGFDPFTRIHNDRAIVVSASDQNNKKASFSNYGLGSTISAPGVDIYSSTPNNNFDYLPGTSMAAPIISGTVALMKSINPNLSNQEIIQILKTTSYKTDQNIGGIVQIDEALQYIIDNYENNEMCNCNQIKNEYYNFKKKYLK